MMAWTKRVGELHRLTHDYHETQPAMVRDYDDTPEMYVAAMCQYIFDCTPSLDTDEQRVVQNELERIVGIY